MSIPLGDPHFKGWSGEWFDYHGECDLVFLSAPEFANGLGLDIHMRTTIRYEYSHIEAAAIKIGEETFEIGGWGDYMLNGVQGAQMPNKISDYPITHEWISEKVQKFKIHISETDVIEMKHYKDMVTVNVPQSDEFNNAIGLLGSYPSGLRVARDGQTIIEDFNEFGQEWQVLDTEPKIFETIRQPQFPTQCRLPVAKAQSRRLGESIAEETARKACASWGGAIEQCVYDVMATGDLEYAEAGAF